MGLRCPRCIFPQVQILKEIKLSETVSADFRGVSFDTLYLHTFKRLANCIVRLHPPIASISSRSAFQLKASPVPIALPESASGRR